MCPGTDADAERFVHDAEGQSKRISECQDLCKIRALYSNAARIYDCLGENQESGYATYRVNDTNDTIKTWIAGGFCRDYNCGSLPPPGGGGGVGWLPGAEQLPPQGSACPMSQGDLNKTLAYMSQVADALGYDDPTQTWATVHNQLSAAGCSVPSVNDCLNAQSNNQFPPGCGSKTPPPPPDITGCGRTYSVKDIMCRSVVRQSQQQQ
jgi:hypothetical protein